MPLFEKVLSASDAGRIGRLVLPKACAEVYLCIKDFFVLFYLLIFNGGENGFLLFLPLFFLKYSSF